MMQSSHPTGAADGDSWFLSPDDAAFTSALDEQLDKAITEKRVWNRHGVIIVRKGRLALERYFEGGDSARGQPLGTVAFAADTLHDLRSVSKSIVGLLYGIALGDAKVPPPEAPLLDSFPEHADLPADRARSRWTIHHALTMTLGTDWDELSVPYTDPTNSEVAMDRAPDRYRFVLGGPVVMEPGTRWTYCGGATALLARIIARGTGKPLHAYAREALLDPLRAGPTEWLADPDGEAFAASGARMSPRDLVRIGMMMLHGGVWRGRQLVPASWIERSTTPVVDVDEMRRYGYHWYLGKFAFTVAGGPRWHRSRLEPLWGALGNGGQRLYLFPTLGLAMAVTAGNYDDPDQWIPPNRIIREVVLPSLS